MSRPQGSECSVQHAETRIQRPEFKIQIPASKVQRPTLASRFQEFRYASYINVIKYICNTWNGCCLHSCQNTSGPNKKYHSYYDVSKIQNWLIQYWFNRELKSHKKTALFVPAKDKSWNFTLACTTNLSCLNLSTPFVGKTTAKAFLLTMIK